MRGFSQAVAAVEATDLQEAVAAMGAVVTTTVVDSAVASGATVVEREVAGGRTVVAGQEGA